MAKNTIRGAAASLFAAVLIAVGCTGGPSVSPADISGIWNGSFTLSYAGGGSTSGLLDLSLEQQGDFASGSFTWVPKDLKRSATGRVDGDEVILQLHFRCAETDIDSSAPSRSQITVLTATIAGSTLTFNEASGFACPTGGPESQVTAVTAVLTRTSNGAPLESAPAPPRD